MQEHKHHWETMANKKKYCSSCGVLKEDFENTKINFYQAYSGGRVKVEATVKGKRYILDFDNIEQILARMIELYGFTETKTKQQKIPRLIIKSL